MTLTFDEICSLLKKLKLMKVVHCLNRSWIHDSYYRQPIMYCITDQLSEGNVWIPSYIPKTTVKVNTHYTWYWKPQLW